MSVKLQKEHIKLSEIICSKYFKTTVESDVIVPDIKPDILKILQADSDVTINQKYIQGEKVFIKGTVRLNILYVPDNGILGSVKAINAVQEFDHCLDIPEAKGEKAMFVDAECESLEYTLVNSRKLSARTKLTFCVRLSEVKEFDIATGIEDGPSMEAKSSLVKLYNPYIETTREIVVKERLEVPMGKPQVLEVLKFSAKAYPLESRISEGQLTAKGEIKVCTLYHGDSDESAPEVMEHTVNFGELVEIEGLKEDMSVEADYFIKDCYFEICQDSDGDCRTLSCEFIVEVGIRAFETIKLNALKDAYSRKCPVKIEKSTYSLEQLLGCACEKISVAETVNVPDYLPDVKRMCKIEGNPSIENVVIENSEISVYGYLTCSVLYLSADESQPASGFSHVIPFSHAFMIDGVCESSACDAKADCEHIECVISDDKTLKVRANVTLNVKATCKECIDAVSDITLLEESFSGEKASASIYFVKDGDTLWDIAKRYHTSSDAILSANGKEEDILKPGKCIYIFK